MSATPHACTFPIRHTPTQLPSPTLSSYPALGLALPPCPLCVPAQVVEFWASRPGDGYVYYVLRPPWVAADKLDSFFALHPEVGSSQHVLQWAHIVCEALEHRPCGIGERGMCASPGACQTRLIALSRRVTCCP